MNVKRKTWASGFRARLIERSETRSTLAQVMEGMMFGSAFTKTYYAKFPKRMRRVRVDVFA